MNVNGGEDRIHILHVDDNAEFLQLFSFLFKNTFQITSSEESMYEPAIREKLSAGTVDVVVVDYEMPEMNGIDLLKHIKRDFPDLPVIFYTGQGNEEIAREAFISGASDYFVKNLREFAQKERFVHSVKNSVEKSRIKYSYMSERERAQKYLEIAAVITVILDRDMRVTFINQKGSEILGYPREEIIGKTWYDHFIPSEELEAIREMQGRFLSEGTQLPDYMESSILRKDKTELVIAWHFSFLKDSSGNVLSIISSGIDITERRKMEEDLRRLNNEMEIEVQNRTAELYRKNQELLTQQEQQKALLDSIPDFAWLKDQELRYIAGNKPFAMAVGMEPENLKGKTDFDLWPENLAQRFQADDKEVISTKSIKRMEEPFAEMDGGERLVETIRVPIIDARGNAIGTSGIARDITERKAMETELANAKISLNNIINSIPDPVFIKDQKHRWVLLNEAFNTMIGHSREELLGKSDFDIFPDSEAEVFWEKDEIVFRTGRENVNEELLTDASGVTRTILTKKILFNDAQGQPHIVGLIRDITREKEMEKRLENEKFFREKIVNSISELVFVKNSDFCYSFVNDAFCSFTGKTRNELINKSDYDLFHKNEADIFRQRDEMLLKTGQETEFNEYYTSTQGTVRMLKVKRSFYQTSSGEKYIISTAALLPSQQVVTS